MDKTCVCCGRRFTSRDERQHYCTHIACQRMRKRKWQRQKLITDKDYKANQADAQKRWRETHPDYWRDYRVTHPEYRERNRGQQHQRNALRKGDGSGVYLQAESEIAKMDAAPPLKSGTYRLIPYGVPLIAKMDAMVVELSLVSAG